MTLIGNLIWFLFGGLITAIGWFISGLILCLTIIGIPLGLQCFKMMRLTLAPFGKDIQFKGGTGSIIVNVLWAVFFGWELFVAYLFCGLINCVFIITIPFGLQSFKMARLALAPFGSGVITKRRIL